MKLFRAAGVAAALAAGAAAADKSPAKDKSAKPVVVIAPLAADVMAEAVRAEQDAYIRRLDVCTRLRQVAADAADDALARKADDLEKAATAVYQERVAKLGVRPTTRAAELKLDLTLGGGAAVNPLTVAPPKPAASAATAELREVKP